MVLPGMVDRWWETGFQCEDVSRRTGDFVVVKIDMENAFNEVSRASILEAFEEEPSLQHFRGHVAVIFAPGVGWDQGELDGDFLWRGMHKGTR